MSDPISRRALFRLAAGRDLAATPAAPLAPDPGYQAALVARFDAGADGLLHALEPLAPQVCELAGVDAGQAVLDAGAGAGNVALEAARRGARVTAVDLAPGMVERGSERSKLLGLELGWLTADVEQLPLEDERFDAALSVLGAALAPRPLVALQELARVLRPHGRLVLAAPTGASLVGRASRMTAAPPRPRRGWGSPGVVRDWLEQAATWANVTVGTHRWTMRIPSAAAAWEALAGPFGLEERSRDRFLDQLSADSTSTTGANGIALEERWLIALATRSS